MDFADFADFADFSSCYLPRFAELLAAAAGDPQKMKVAELKEALAARGLDTGGLNAVLQQWLQEAIAPPMIAGDGAKTGGAAPADGGGGAGKRPPEGQPAAKRRKWCNVRVSGATKRCDETSSDDEDGGWLLRHVSARWSVRVVYKLQ